MIEQVKPPIGASPAFVVLPYRLKDLADAISRYAEHKDIMDNQEITELIRKWSKEIIGTCDTIDMIRKWNKKKILRKI